MFVPIGKSNDNNDSFFPLSSQRGKSNQIQSNQTEKESIETDLKIHPIETEIILLKENISTLNDHEENDQQSQMAIEIKILSQIDKENSIR